MSLPFDLPTSVTFNSLHLLSSPLCPVNQFETRPPTLSQIKGAVYTAPGLQLPNGYKIYLSGGELLCLVNKNLKGFDRSKFVFDIQSIRNAIEWEMNRVLSTYKAQPFKRLIGLSHLHHYRMVKSEMQAYIRSVLGLEAEATISYHTPTTIAQSLSPTMLKRVEQLPIPVAVIRNHKIDGCIYLALEMRGHLKTHIPVAVVSELNTKTIGAIKAVVQQRKAIAEGDGEYWESQVNNIVTSINALEAIHA